MGSSESEPCLFVIFGATGDLTRRKLLPALYHLARRGMLAHTHILGVARTAEFNDSSFRKLAREIVGAADDWCDRCVHYRSVGDGATEQFQTLAAEIANIERQNNLTGNRVFYLALPEQSFAPTIRGIGAARLQQSGGWTRIVVEKPFGRDLQSAIELNTLIHSLFDESQIFRIDHYLGKETVQNLLVFRFANPIFERLWNRDHIEKVRITVAEDGGVGNRAGYYDQTGALRDMVQNHLMQILSLVSMEVPGTLRAEDVREEKVKVLRSIAPIESSDVLFGQYEGYLEEAGIPKGSRTETFVSVQLKILNWRWSGVPFQLRTGKRLPLRSSEIAITFHPAPVSFFETRHNVLVISIQPDEGFAIKFQIKTPGSPITLTTQELSFRYGQVFSSLLEGYETLLQDILTGDRSLFVRADWIEESWRLFDAILQSPPPVRQYASGTWGPD